MHRKSRIVVYDTDIPKSRKNSSVPEAAGWRLCFRGHSAIIPRMGLGGKKGWIQPLWSIQFNHATSKMITARHLCIIVLIFLLLVWQLIQPNKARSRLKGRISIAEFNKYLQSHCGFLCTRTRRKNLTRC